MRRPIDGFPATRRRRRRSAGWLAAASLELQRKSEYGPPAAARPATWSGESAAAGGAAGECNRRSRSPWVDRRVGDRRTMSQSVGRSTTDGAPWTMAKCGELEA